MTNDTAWQIDRKLSISALGTGLSSIVVAVSLITTLASRIEHLERKATSLETDIKATRTISIGMARLEERLESLQHTLEELRGEVRHQYREATSLPSSYSSGTSKRQRITNTSDTTD